MIVKEASYPSLEWRWPDSTPIFSTARTLWPAGFTDVDFGLGVSLADEAAARSRVSQLSP
jgi:hypothetical protein